MLNFQLRSRTILTGLPDQPCPVCRVGTIAGAPCSGSPEAPCAGVCEGSPNQGGACVSTNPSGLTKDCPAPIPVPGASVCYRGPNNNNPCTGGSDCPGGTCSSFIGDIPISLNPLTTDAVSKSDAGSLFCPGQTANTKGAFKSDICTKLSTNSGTACSTNTDCPGGGCRPGSLKNLCNGGTNDGKGCSLDTDCGGGVCVKAGILAQLIRASGAPAGALTIGTPASLKLASIFCVPLTGNAAVDGNANLPGPGATALAGTFKLLP
jgi:hypothetical protein